MNLFGRKKNIPQPTHAIQNLQSTLATLEKREDHLSKQISLLKNQAKLAIKEKQKKKAIYLLRKSKLFEKQLETIWNTKMNIDVQIVALTQAISSTEIVKSLEIGRDVLANNAKKLNPDHVADVIDDIGERIADVNDIAESLAQPIGQVEDDDELLKELEELDDELLEDEIVSLPSLPSVQKTHVITEEDELKELDALMLA